MATTAASELVFIMAGHVVNSRGENFVSERHALVDQCS